MENLSEALTKEIQRNRELLEMYKTIPTGVFGAIMIDADIKAAVNALATGDVVQMARAYEAIKDNE